MCAIHYLLCLGSGGALVEKEEIIEGQEESQEDQGSLQKKQKVRTRKRSKGSDK